MAACRLETGHQIPAAAATEAWAERAQAAGAAWIVVGTAQRGSAELTLIAAGPWSPVAVTPIWGVTASVRMEHPPRHALEEAVIEEIATMAGEVAPAFAAVTTGGVTTIGATFLAAEPDHVRIAPTVVARATGFLPGIASAVVVGSRACARPVTPDGRPLIGPLPGEDDVWVATGNGPWGMSCGPATARIAVDAMLGRATIPPTLDISRLG